MVKQQDKVKTFSCTGSSKDHLNIEQLPQNLRTLVEDTRMPEKQPNLFKRRDQITSLVTLPPFDVPFSPPGHLYLLPPFLFSTQLCECWDVESTQRLGYWLDYPFQHPLSSSWSPLSPSSLFSSLYNYVSLSGCSCLWRMASPIT